MKKIIFILVIICFWKVSFSQNTHFQFRLDSTSAPKSAVTIVHSSSVAYLIQTKSNNNSVYVSDINPTNMQPLNVSFFCNLGNFSSIYLNGGYKDFDDNLIVYGYAIFNAQYHSLIVKIDLNLGSMTYAYGEGVEIIEGCCGEDVHGDMYHLFLLKKMNDQNIEVIAYNSNLTPITKSFRPRLGTITDISWDSCHTTFIVSGSYSYNSPTNRIDPFLIYLKCGDVYQDFFHIESALRISNQQFFQRAEGRTLHEILDSKRLILIQDLRDTISDHIWIILIDNYSNQPAFKSRIFELPRPKLILQDAKFDSLNKKLTILGRNVLCENGINFIAQIDPYSLANFNIAEIMDSNYYSSCTISDPFGPPDTTYGNEIYLQRLELNPYNSCHTILSTGINREHVYITETYDIANPQCDRLIYTVIHTPILTTLNPPPAYFSNFTLLGINSQDSSNNSFLIKDTLCYDMKYCGKGAINPNMNNQLTKSTPYINLYSCDYFECHHFSETVSYYLYDLTGKTLFQGTTENGIKTLLPNFTNGIYILSVVDKDGNKKSEKIIYFK